MALPARRTDSLPVISLRDVTLCHDRRVIQRHLSFDVRAGSVFAIMGASGAGKSTVLRSMVGLMAPKSGAMLVGDIDYWSARASERAGVDRRFGVLFQKGALWSSLTVAENIALPMQMLTDMDDSTIRRMVELKLALVGLEDASDLLPGQLSGGMVKRAGLARALALNPEVLFLDEPSSGLDPISARHLDDLILDLRDALHKTIVIVSHDLANLFATADDGIFLDDRTHTAIAHGSPAALRDRCEDRRVQAFMRRGEIATARVKEVI